MNTKVEAVTAIKNEAKEMQKPAREKGPFHSTTYRLCRKFTELQSGLPAELLDDKTLNQLTTADINMRHTQIDIVEKKNPTSETLHVIENTTAAFAHNPTTYNQHQPYATQKIPPLKDTERELTDKRNGLKTDMTKFIENFYANIRKIGQEGIDALKGGTNESPVREKVIQQINNLFKSIEKERKELNSRTANLDINESALQIKLNALEIETRNIGAAAGIKISPAPTTVLRK